MNLRHNNVSEQSFFAAMNCMEPTNIQAKHSMHSLSNNLYYMIHNGMSQVTKSESSNRHTRHHHPLIWLLLSHHFDPPFSGLYIRRHWMKSDSFIVELFAITTLHTFPCFLSLLSTTLRYDSWRLIRTYKIIASVSWHNYPRHCVITEKRQQTFSPPYTLW